MACLRRGIESAQAECGPTLVHAHINEIAEAHTAQAVRELARTDARMVNTRTEEADDARPRECVEKAEYHGAAKARSGPRTTVRVDRLPVGRNCD